MPKSHSISTSVAVLFACASLLPTRARAQQAPSPRPRSVLFYLVDTCRGDRMGFDGYERETTPFLDRLAAQSVVFEACYSQAAWTKPSMASMLTSQYPSATGIYRMDQRLEPDFVTWPEVLHAQGLFTAGFSANIVMGNTLSGLAQGFEHFVESTDINDGDPIRFASGSARRLNERVFRWLDDTNHWPMLLYVHSVDPHEEYEPEPRYLERFADPERHASFRQEWKTLLDSRPPIPGLFVTQQNFAATGIDSVSFIRHASNLYDADVSANDDELGRLWNKLQEDGWGEDLILVVTSDHGEEFFDHGGTSHGYSLYEEMIRVPLLIHAPGLLPAGARVTTPVRSLDLFPTLCELLGLAPPAGLQGESLVPLARGARVEPRTVFAEHREDPILRRIGLAPGSMTSLRSGRWKLIVNELASQVLTKPELELYDLEADPDERVNVAAAHPEVVARLRQEFEAFAVRREATRRTAAAAELPSEALADLSALGYIGNEDEDESEEEGEDRAAAAADLWPALESGDFERIRRSLEAGADPHTLEPATGVSPLATAVLCGERELVELLLAAGSRVDVRNADGSTALSSAAFFGRVELLQFLLAEGADPAARNPAGETALSATRAPWNVTQFIADLFGVTLVRAEVEAGRKRCAEILGALEKPATPDARLFEALRTGDQAAFERALAEGASLAALETGSGMTPLASAAFHGREELARLLLARGAKVQAHNQDGSSALHAAALLGHVTLIELLHEHGADLDARDAKGSTPLHAAAFLGRAEAVRALLQAGAAPALADASGQTPIDVTRTAWSITEYVLGLLGLELERATLEAGRAECVKLLRE